MFLRPLKLTESPAHNAKHRTTGSVKRNSVDSVVGRMKLVNLPILIGCKQLFKNDAFCAMPCCSIGYLSAMQAQKTLGWLTRVSANKKIAIGM